MYEKAFETHSAFLIGNNCTQTRESYYMLTRIAGPCQSPNEAARVVSYVRAKYTRGNVKNAIIMNTAENEPSTFVIVCSSKRHEEKIASAHKHRI